MSLACPLRSRPGLRSPRRVLVVEDNATLRALLALALESNGYVPIAAESCEAALEFAVVDPPDAWIIDQTLPGASGSDLIRFLRSSDDVRLREAPVLGVSGGDEGVVELRLAGAWQTLKKPLDERRLFAWLEGGCGPAACRDQRPAASSVQP